MLVNDLLDLINSGIDFDAQNYMIMNTDKCFNGGHSSQPGPNHGNNTPRQCCGEFPAQGQVEISSAKYVDPFFNQLTTRKRFYIGHQRNSAVSEKFELLEPVLTDK
jgi:hypothetical protein